jgi:hypothetical protein
VEDLAVVEALARAQGHLAVLDTDLNAPAVQLDLTHPIGTVGWVLDQLAEREPDEVGKSPSGGALPVFCWQTSERRLSDELHCRRLCAWLWVWT